MAAVSAGHARRYTARLTQSLWPEYDAPTSSDSKKKKKKSPHEFRYSPFTSRRSLNRDIHDYSSQYDDLCAFDENELSVRVTSSSMSHEDVFSHLLYPPVESTSTPTPVTGDDKIPLQSYRHSSSSSSSSSTCAALPVRKSPTVTVTAPVNSRHRMATPVSVGTPTVADILQGRCEHPPVRHKSGGFRYSTFTDIPRELHSCHPTVVNQKTRRGESCHQCKNSQLPSQFLYCGRKKCFMRFCLACFRRKYPQLAVPQTAHWECPRCLGICSCSSCSGVGKPRRGGRGARVAMSDDTDSEDDDELAYL
ncbi:MAG: hypothetical protein MHM6MM_002842 [Cercozoa sp. M6MM]